MKLSHYHLFEFSVKFAKGKISNNNKNKKLEQKIRTKKKEK